MEKIYLVYRVLDSNRTIKTAFKTKEAAKTYKMFMDANGQKTSASWIEEIEIGPNIEYNV